jgi:hypothetical protein
MITSRLRQARQGRKACRDQIQTGAAVGYYLMYNTETQITFKLWVGKVDRHDIAIRTNSCLFERFESLA